MSSISIATPSILVPRPTTRLRITQRGRRVVTALVALPIACAVGFAALSSGAAVATAETPAVSFETVTVLPGDTLWAIAESIAPGVDPRIVIDEILALNGLRSGSVQVGQQLAIPAQYSE